MQYDQQLLPEHSPAVYQMYREFLLEHLDQHLGRQTSVRVRKVLEHLQRLGTKDLFKQLVALFRNEYADRHSLIEELNELAGKGI